MSLRAGDTLPRYAIARWRAEATASHISILFGDEDRWSFAGRRIDPWLKPSFDPDLLLVQNALGRAVVVRASAIPHPGLTDHALALAMLDGRSAVQATARHVPQIMITRRRSATAPWRDIDHAALVEALRRDGRGAQLFEEVAGLPRVQWPVPQPAPLVSIIIATRDRAELLAACVDGLLNRTHYQPIEVVIADNDTQQPEALALFQQWSSDPRVRIVRCPGPFNYSAINNHAASLCRGTIVVFLNNDTEVVHPDWLRELVSQAARPEIGCVGARLLFPNGQVQHQGVVMGIGGVAGHYLAFSKERAAGPQDTLRHARRVSAVTAACLALRRDVFDATGGFDATSLPIAYNDVDLCLRVRALGLHNLVTPYATLIHKESASRGDDLAPGRRARWEAECAVMQDRWRDLIETDPHFHPSLERTASTPCLRIPPPGSSPLSSRDGSLGIGAARVSA